MVTALRGLALLCALLLCAPAWADPPTPPPGAIQYATPATLAVSNSSSRVALPIVPVGPFQFALIINNGTADAFFALGPDNTVVATTSSLPLPAGACYPVWLGSNTNLAAITGSGSTTLRIVQATGPITASCPGTAGSGTISGTVTANQGTAGASAWPFKIDQTTPGTTNGVQVNAGTALIGAVETYNRQDVTPTVQNAAYASGNDIGGLVSFTLPRTASGLLQSVGVQFIGGATTQINVACFDSNPSGSTFTDKSTFTIAAADQAKKINKSLLALTPAAQTGDAVTAASVDNYAQPFNSTGTIYCAYASTGTLTPASTTDMRVNIKVVQSAQ